MRRNYNLCHYWLEVSLDDLASFDPLLADKLCKVPSDYLPLVCIYLITATPIVVCLSLLFSQFEEAAREAADELTQPRPLGEEKVEDIQIMLHSDANPFQIRQLKVSFAAFFFLFYYVYFFKLLRPTVRQHSSPGKGPRYYRQCVHCPR